MTMTPPTRRISSARAVQGAVSVPLAATVVIPYLSREEQLQEALGSWFAQDYVGHLGVIVVDFSDKSSTVDLSRVRVLRSQNTRWNISRAKNIGARNAKGDLLIFAHADMLVAPNFASWLLAQWDEFDMWICDGLHRNLPHDPSLDSLIAVKRWANTRIRGYSEPMMESPHGWGYDAVDYRLRAMAMLGTCGGVVGDYPGSAATLLLHGDSERMEPYDHKNLEITYDQHANYSRWYRTQIGYEANVGQDWGQVW